MSSPASSLDGRVALVTGGGRGLGRALASALAENGAAVAVGARSADEVDAVAGELREAGRTALSVSLDVADPASVAEAVRRVEAELGGIDVLVNSAGVVWPVGLLHKVDVDEWEQSIAINLVGAARCTRAVLPGMLQRSWGRVVNLSSGAAVGTGMPSSSAYSVGKAGLDMLTANLGAELDGTGVQIVGVRPGVVDTSMQDYMRSLPREQVGETFYEKFHGMHERGELIGPERAVALVLGLLAGDRSGVTLDVRDDEVEQLIGNA